MADYLESVRARLALQSASDLRSCALAATMLSEDASNYAGVLVHYIDLCRTHHESILEAGLVEAMNLLVQKIEHIESTLAGEVYE